MMKRTIAFCAVSLLPLFSLAPVSVADDEENMIDREEIERQMTTKVQKDMLLGQPSSWNFEFTAILAGLADDAYKFKGTIICFDDWDDQLGRPAEVVGSAKPYDEEWAKKLLGSMAPKGRKYTTTLSATFSRREAGMEYREASSIESCTFKGLKFKKI